MQALIDSLGPTLYSHDSHTGYMIKWKLIAPLCKKWSRNRDADMERVREMVEYHHKGGYIPRMIHLAELNDEGLVCYDGNHRREVFNACSSDKDIMCVIDVMFGATQNDVYKAFNNINKAVQLPAIYIEEANNENNIKADILKLVKEYETKYRAFLSASARCHAPNFNRDGFTDNIYSIYKALGCVIGIEQIKNLLERLNTEYAQGRMCRPHSVYKHVVVDKCKKYNMWLFIEKTIPFEHMEQLLR